MSRDEWTCSLERLFPSDHAAGRIVVDEVVARLAEHRWTEREIFEVRLALEEAVANAIRHGNASDPDKEVQVQCNISARQVWIEVTDQGFGFCPEDVPDPTHPDRLEVPSGRGVMLMRQYMTRVEYNDRGNVVVMEKSRSAGS